MYKILLSSYTFYPANLCGYNQLEAKILHNQKKLKLTDDLCNLFTSFRQMVLLTVRRKYNETLKKE